MVCMDVAQCATSTAAVLGMVPGWQGHTALLSQRRLSLLYSYRTVCYTMRYSGSVYSHHNLAGIMELIGYDRALPGPP